MSFIAPVLGAGQISGDGVLRGSREIIDFEDAFTETGIELQFFSNSGELVGIIGSNYEKSNLVDLDIELTKIGDLKKFKFTVGRLLNIPFFNDMEVRFYKNTIHFFSGLLTVQPGQGRRDIQYEFEGKGYIDFAKRIKVEKLYQNEDISDIVIDLVTDLANNSRVLYNSTLIDLPSYTVTKLELKKKTIEKGIKEVLEIVNTQYQDQQYRYGVNKNREFFFLPVSNDIVNGFFEGYQMQEPDIDEDLGDMVNKINIYRAQEDSQNVEFINSYSDSDSIDEWGLFEKDITISDYVDTTTAARIANAMLSRYSNPVTKAEANNIIVEDFTFDFGFYLFNTRLASYINQLSDFEKLSTWTYNISNTTITVDDTKTISKNNAFKVVTASGSDGEYMDFELDDELYFPTKLIIYVSISQSGDYFDIIAYDDENNSESLGLDLYKETENGDEKITEDGEHKILEKKSMQIDLEGEFFRFELPINTLSNIKKIRILFLTNETITFFFDRMDLETYSWKQYNLVLEKIKYKISKANIKASMVFGEDTTDLIKDLKKLDEKSDNILNIFQKS